MITAVTGGIAEGKSTVLGYLSDLGVKTLSADAVSRQVFQEPSVNMLLAKIVGLPSPVLPADLREVLVARPEIRRAVNRTMHPRIMAIIKDSDARFVEVPLLLEACLQGWFQEVWVVTCGVQEQMKRLEQRYGREVNSQALMSAQLPTDSKIPFADVVIRTNCASEAVRRNVSEALQRRFAAG